MEYALFASTDWSGIVLLFIRCQFTQIKVSIEGKMHECYINSR